MSHLFGSVHVRCIASKPGIVYYFRLLQLGEGIFLSSHRLILHLPTIFVWR